VRYFREHKPEAETAMRVHFKLTDQAAMDKLYERQVDVQTNLPAVAKADFTDVVATMPKDAPQLSDEQRRTIGTTLLAIGVVTTIPAAIAR